MSLRDDENKQWWADYFARKSLERSEAFVGDDDAEKRDRVVKAMVSAAAANPGGLEDRRGMINFMNFAAERLARATDPKLTMGNVCKMSVADVLAATDEQRPNDFGPDATDPETVALIGALENVLRVTITDNHPSFELNPNTTQPMATNFSQDWAPGSHVLDLNAEGANFLVPRTAEGTIRKARRRLDELKHPWPADMASAEK